MSRSVVFYLVAACVAACVVAAGALPTHVAYCMLAWYAASLCLDMYSTVRAGRGAVAEHEVSAIFRTVTMRAGRGAAVAAQAALELCLALLVAPPILGYDMLHVPAAAAFCGAAAVSHTYGFVSNVRR